MNFNKYYTSLKTEEKNILAKKLETSKAYLDQLSSGFRSPSKDKIESIEKETNGTVNILSWFNKTEKAA